jgi:phage shock protein C
MTYQNERRGLYRSRKGIIMGVVRGLAEYFDISVFWSRVIVLLVCLFTGFWPVVIVYVLAALIMKPEPVSPLNDDSEREFYDSYASSRVRAVHRLKRKFDGLDRRIRRMEDMVTSRDYDWEERLNR